ncbi:MAG: hypothetical protein EBZ40_11765, partial [Gammaproteobacteria bacterium]|nr:hypothetical protein [Gammaproteobacteria bacterium]
SASLSVSGTAATDGGTEVRVKNVAMHADIIASSAQANIGVYGVNGVPYVWDSGTSAADPGTGRLRFNNATLSSATTLYISETGATSESLASWLASWTSQGASPFGTLYIVKIGAVGNQAIFNVTSTMTDVGSYQSCTISFVSSTGSFSNGDPIGVLWVPRGVQGNTGPQGSDGGIRWTFSTTTTMADPGSGNFRLNNATLGSATAFAISALTAETGNPSAAGWVRTWDDSTTTARRGTLTLRKSSGTQNFVILDITSVLTDNSTWLTGSCSVRDAQGTIANGDTLLVSFSPAGDKGFDGAGSGTMTGLTAGPGLSSSGVGATGGTISVSGTLTSIEAVNAQTGTSYTVLATDHARLLTCSNASSVAVTLPQATGSFGAGFYLDIANVNAGVVTITPTTSTINGAASLVLNRFLSVRLVSDGTNWTALHGSSLRTQTTTVASASTTDIGATASQRISVTGTTTITSLGTVPNQLRFVTFAGALTLTHNATTLILPGSANIATAAGDAAVLSSDASGNWRCLHYQKADGTAVVGGAASGAPSEPQGRLTLSSGTPVMVSTVSAATTVFYSPYVGRFVPLYNGTTYTMTDVGGELSQATTDSTKSPTACASNSNYDLFVWNDGGTLRCTRGPAWTSDNARGTGAGSTELVRINGILLNANAITNGPAAQRGTFVGTIRTNASSQVDWTFAGSAAAGRFSVWNAYNRVSVASTVFDPTDSWTYTTATWRQSNGAATNQISIVAGLAENAIRVTAIACGANATPVYVSPGVGVNSTTANSATLRLGGMFGTIPMPCVALYSAAATLGWTTYSWLEISQASGTSTWFGDNGGIYIQTGMTAEFFA